MADRLRAFPRAEAPVWARVAEEEDLVAAVAGVGNGSSAVFLVACKLNGENHAANEAEPRQISLGQYFLN